MLKFLATGTSGGATGDVISEVFQITEVSDIVPLGAIAEGKGLLLAWVDFNRAAGTVDTKFTLEIEAFDIDLNSLGAPVSIDLLTDSNPQTWERACLEVVLPINTRLIHLRLKAEENISDDGANEFGGHYADLVQLEGRVLP